jgi:putative ABC transport system permease protein
VEWESLGINFVMLFSPNTFRGAPHTILATLTYPDGGDQKAEVELQRLVANEFPAVTTVRVKEALQTINALVADIAVAVRGREFGDAACKYPCARRCACRRSPQPRL